MAAKTAYLRLDAKGRATLPEEVRRDLHLAVGDFLLLERTERGTYELVPATLVPKDQLWFLNPEMRSRVAQGEGTSPPGARPAPRPSSKRRTSSTR